MLCRIADFTVEFKNKYPYTETLCRDYVCYGEEADLTVSLDEGEAEKELSESESADIGYCEALCLYRKLCLALPKRGALMLHSAVAEMNGEGFGFFGKSGSGKTTHLLLWKRLFKDDVSVVNGDKPIYRFDGDALYAYGTPWCGKERLQNNKKARIVALGLIKKAKENSVRRLSLSEAAGALVEQVMFPSEAEGAIATMDFLDMILKAVPVYEISCNISTDAARLAYSAMKGEKL